MKTKVLLLCIMLLAFSASVNAAIVEMSAVPTNWKMENYTGSGSLWVWNAGSSCDQGIIKLPDSVAAEVRNRFYGMIMAAKLNDKPVIIRYNNGTINCYIESFAIQGW